MVQIIRNEQVTVGTTSTSVSAAPTAGQRYALSIVNTSTGGQTITLSWQTQAQANAGVVLYPAGTHSESVDSAFIPLNTEIFAISSAAGGSLSIHERILE
jgi:hypothetical protein